MPAAPSPFFVSYRRRDAGLAANWIAHQIRGRFGQETVFLDTDSTRLGEYWEEQIGSALGSARVLIAVIGPDWLRLTDEFGRRRIDKDDDWVRRELEMSIERGIPIVPIAVSGAAVPPPDALPTSLKPLCSYPFISLRETDWEQDLKQLLDMLRSLTKLPINSHIATRSGRDLLNIAQRDIALQQIAALKTAISLVYRARNSARTLADPKYVRKATDRRAVHQVLDSYMLAVENILYEERALLPETLFPLFHEAKNVIIDVMMSAQRLECGVSELQSERLEDRREVFQKEYLRLDAALTRMVRLVQSYIGLHSDERPQEQ